MATSSTSSNNTTQIDTLTLLELLKKSQERYEAAENKIKELQEKIDEQPLFNNNNNNEVPLVLRPAKNNLEGFSTSKVPLAKLFKLDNKSVQEVKKTFGLLLDNNNIPKKNTISKVDPLMIKKWLAIASIFIINLLFII